MSNKITFIDNVGRTIVGELESTSGETVSVKNPVMIHVNQTPQGQLQVQMLPLFFAEFLDTSTRTNGVTWDYNSKQITIAKNLELDSKLADQYDKIFNPTVLVTPQNSGAPIIKLF